MIGANLGSRCITAVYSEYSTQDLHKPEQYGDYIRHFGFFTSTNVLQLCSCSYGDKWCSASPLEAAWMTVSRAIFSGY